jgi:tRNA pseudouridine synthase 9
MNLPQRYALDSGVTTINGKVAKPETVVRNGDRIEWVLARNNSEMFINVDCLDMVRNVVHRHEPPVTATPVKVVLHDKERGFLVIDKPGSIVCYLYFCRPNSQTSSKPVHASGRYYRHSLVEILRHEFGFDRVYSASHFPSRLASPSCKPAHSD